MNDDQNNVSASKHYPIVGRIDDINLEKRYTVTVQGRKIIDYEKIKIEDPLLYQKVVENENKPDPYNDVSTAQGTEIVERQV